MRKDEVRGGNGHSRDQRMAWRVGGNFLSEFVFLRAEI